MATLNDTAWANFFDRSEILAEIKWNGFAYVSADELRDKGGREPRLMAKLDTLAERPQIFEQYDLNILPVQNGQYVLFQDRENRSYFPFKSLLDEVQVEAFDSQIDLPSFDTFPLNRAFSESQAIDFAYVSSLLQHFCQCQTMYLSIRGRLSSGSFPLILPDFENRIEVSNVQIEVDSGYENDDQIVLLEAKIGRRTDFHIRQLVFPYLQWSARTKKKIRPIFLTYSNGQYVLTEFAVGMTYGELEVVSNRAFTVNDSEVAVINLAQSLQSVEEDGEPVQIPFPQANDMDKVIDTIQLIDLGLNTKSAIAEFFEFGERQSYYYTDAGRYLGLVEKVGQSFVLTEAGREFQTLAARTQRTKAIFRQMMRRPSLRAALQLVSTRQFDLTTVSDAEIAEIIMKHSCPNLSRSTSLRRASTLRKWFRWLLKNSSVR
ncbi:MAG: hypothetical protein JSS83_22285 [Cyanobacteria bacterium SZAS LIN-3]|nr:hypothetical protein [Cyanobacteria bacterium SZAS LIN-3]